MSALTIKSSAFHAFGIYLLLTLACCLPTGDSIPHRYFLLDAPEPEELFLSDSIEGTHLRLRRIESSAYLRDRIAWRSAEGEAGFMEFDRWAENPANALDRILAKRLYESCGFTRTFQGGSESLEVRLIAADEFRVANPQVVILARAIHVSPQQVARWEETFEERVSIEGQGAIGIAGAMGIAMGRIADRIASKLVISISKER